MKNTVIYIMIMAVLASCSRIEENDEWRYAGETVQAGIWLSLVNGDTTKSINDPETIQVAKDVIKNLWVIQFNGITDDARVLGKPAYIEDFANFGGKVDLIPTEKPCKIYFIANTFEKPGEFDIDQWTTIGGLKQNYRGISGENELFGIDNQGTGHIIFSGSTILEKLDENTGTIKGTLGRNLAKVKITIKNSGESEEIKIQTIQIRSVPSISYYLPDLSSESELFPSADNVKMTDYPVIEWDQTKAEQEFLFYIPVNKRGTTISESDMDKNAYAPDGSTHLLISAVYGTEEYPVTYSFYLGDNLKNDHNIEANRLYEYTFDITTKGNAATDSRVTDWGTVDFTDEEIYQLSNCYILNPIPTGTQMRKFRIPIKRTLEFWGDGTTNLYENNYDYSLRNGAEWECFIITSDFKITDDKFKITKGNGNSSTDSYFEVEVAPGTKGNVIIGVGKKASGVTSVSWSWHLWITDYDPYPALKFGECIQGKYKYAVTGGYVDRYEGTTYWGNNKSAYIMDRNIGALSAVYPIDNIGLLYYQYGRKDPFFYNQDIYQGEKVVYDNFKDANNSTNVNTIAYSVLNPLNYIEGYNSNAGEETWIDNQERNMKYVNDEYVWNDPHTAASGGNPGGKSIFDPCPPGYRLPDKGIWEDWKPHGTKEKNEEVKYATDGYTTNIISGNSGEITADIPLNRGFKAYVTIKGEQYWPWDNGNNIPDPAIFYPSSGLLDEKTGKVRMDANKNIGTESWGFVWSEDSYNFGKGYAHAPQPDNLVKSTSHRKSRGLPVRCITDMNWINKQNQ